MYTWRSAWPSASVLQSVCVRVVHTLPVDPWAGKGPVCTRGLFPWTRKQPKVRLLSRWACPGLALPDPLYPTACSKTETQYTQLKQMKDALCISLLVGIYLEFVSSVPKSEPPALGLFLSTQCFPLQTKFMRKTGIRKWVKLRSHTHKCTRMHYYTCAYTQTSFNLRITHSLIFAAFSSTTLASWIRPRLCKSAGCYISKALWKSRLKTD